MNDVRLKEHLLQLQGEEIIWVGGKAFMISPASLEDVERIDRGYFLDEQPRGEGPR